MIYLFFCETYVGGTHHRTPFASSTTQTAEVLELMHSDVCGKIEKKSLGAEYFLTFTDGKTILYTWVYS